MDGDNATLDTIFLVVGAVLILLTGLRVSRRRSDKKPMEGQRAFTIGILVWLALMGVALYMIFG
ncbi:MAG TPA: hypothetical protein VKN16_24280 [Methylomirabilota bacterium]|jgi:4-amino-4-deoxy-L-arabinose transferase-like glycosyltransferase|nr:hypothetical protein [Methylomirabilota bacterium]